ncbi:RecA-like DNA recombinase [Microbacterium phage Juicer]|nr:RecA-like DNA recombinase [Microbacterium phage Juicer]
MGTESLGLMQKVWSHSGVSGHVWMPHIANIGQKDKERFREGPLLQTDNPQIPELRPDVDWYWTPGVSHGQNRRVKRGQRVQYPAQRALWADCDDNYNKELLLALRPTFMWETSPGHMQAVWLMREKIDPSEYHRDGFMGMLTQALGADKSGVDISQLLRVPGTNHHKGKTFKGRIVRNTKAVYTRSQMLASVAKGLGFSPALASELAADDPWGDRSKLLWKFSRRAAELGLPQDLAFKLIKATKWNKWRDEPDRLKEDIARAYDQQPSKPEPSRNPIEDTEVSEESVSAWDMSTVNQFGPVLRKPMSWVLPGMIPEAGCGLIVAAPKVGKTRIAIEIALGLATGKKPLGVSSRGAQPVGFFSLEDGEYLFADRLSKGLQTGRDAFHWDGHIRRDGDNLVWEPGKPMKLFTRFDPVDLSTPEDKQRLLETIVKYELRLVIIDTLSMAIGDHNVSDQKEMNGILKDVRRIARATKCAVVFIHHTRKRVFEKGETIQESILGATALHAWCEFVLSLASPTEDDDLGLLRLGVQTKMGNHLHYINHQLKIIKRPDPEE